MQSEIEESRPMTNIEKFRSSTQQDTNVITVEELKQTLTAHSDFDWEEFKKPYTEIDFERLAKSLDFEKISSQWTQKTFKGAAGKSPFTSYEMKTGHIFTIGSTCNQKNQLLLITDVQSQFCNHSFAFGDDGQKKLLTTDIEEIMKGEVPELRKLAKLDINFMVSASNKACQSEKVMEQLKYLALMHEIAALKIGTTHEPKHQTPQHIGDGFIKHLYDEKKGEDIVKMQLSTQVLKTQNWSEPVQIINLVDSDEVYDEAKGLQVHTMNHQFKTVTQLMRAIQNKNLDVVVQFDSASVKKEGKKLTIKPKMNIVSIVVKGAVQQTSKVFGLNLSKWIN